MVIVTGNNKINCRNSELTPDNNAVDNLFKFLISKENDTVRPRVINIMGRNVKFAKSCGRILDTTFDELCDRVSRIFCKYVGKQKGKTETVVILLN